MRQASMCTCTGRLPWLVSLRRFVLPGLRHFLWKDRWLPSKAKSTITQAHTHTLVCAIADPECTCNKGFILLWPSLSVCLFLLCGVLDSTRCNFFVGTHPKFAMQKVLQDTLKSKHIGVVYVVVAPIVLNKYSIPHIFHSWPLDKQRYTPTTAHIHT